MYPNLYYALNDWFGWKINALKVFYTFGIFVALAFIAAAYFLTLELKRKEKSGLLQPREETIIAGKPASFTELFINALVGFLFGYKLIGAFIASRSVGIDIQDYIFSTSGSWIGGIVLGAVMAFYRYWVKEKEKLAKPEKRVIRVWPHDRVGDLIIFALVFGIIGAKIFDNLENWNRFIQDPLGNLLSPSGLTFYGGLIFATIAILIFARKKGINLLHLTDAAAPALMLAYAVGRIGCQVAGDGDWGVYNSGYVSDRPGHVVPVKSPADFQMALHKYSNYFLNGTITDPNGAVTEVTDRLAPTLDQVPHRKFIGPSFLPSWLFAYTYPHNVNEDGVLLPNCEGKYCRALPQPVFPTPFYETVTCTLLFLGLWSVRKKIKAPGFMFCLYLLLNGIERFLVETIRVNTTYSIFGIHPTQAELISAALVITGVLGMIYFNKRYKASLE
jgi:phosphatidylglycerol---prolipoprotein diacylglyceryl transferase